MASGPSLPHRALSSIRGSTVTDASAAGTPATPLKPLRNIHSTFGSPSTLRAEDEVVILEIGTRSLRVGFSGDTVPRGVVAFGPEQSRRVGDFRAWEGGYEDDWRKRTGFKDWGRDHELWKFDVRGLDLGLVGDRIERALREAFTKYLLIDSKPRRMVLVSPSSMPLPLLSSVLDTLFNRFQPPSVSLLSAPVTTTVAAGARSALVIDLGWSETTVTAVYEYREVHCSRTVRGGRMLVAQMHRMIKRCVAEREGRNDNEPDEEAQRYVASFEECDDLTSKLCWCRPSTAPEKPHQTQEGLATLEEEDEFEDARETSEETYERRIEVPLSSTQPATVIKPSFDQLAEPCENTFFDPQRQHNSFDDEEMPVHLLIYRALLQLPLDVRAVCMSRIIFTGGSANVLGLRGRIFDELSRLVRERGWSGVTGKVVDQQRKNSKSKHGIGQQPNHLASGATSQTDGGDGGQGETHSDAANATPEIDPVEKQLRKLGLRSTAVVQGSLRCLESLGSWSGGSLVTQLKVPAIATVDREVWLQQGAAGAARPNEVDTKSRMSMGAGGLIRGAAAGSTWTLGVWGAV